MLVARVYGSKAPVSFFDFDGLSRNQNTTTKIGGRQNLKDDGQTETSNFFAFRDQLVL